MNNVRSRWAPYAIVSAMLLVAVAGAFGLVAFMQSYKVQNELGLPVLAIAGVVALLGALAVVALSLSAVGATDKTQALALPPGSVRAVIALSLVVLFAILTVFLFSSLHNSGRIDRQDCLNAEQLGTATANLQRAIMVQRQMTLEEAKKCRIQPAASPGEAAAPAFYIILYREMTNPASEDFAKQLLVLIGTLVTSVASFYFGARAVSEARDSVSGLNQPPMLTGIDPTTAKTGEKLILRILGTNLNQVAQLQLILGPNTITATTVTSNEGRVEGTINIPAVAPDGAWDIAVTDKIGRTAKLERALVISKGAPPAPQPDGQPSGGSQPDGQPSGGSQPDGQPSGGSQPDGQPSGGSQPDGQPSGGSQPDGPHAVAQAAEAQRTLARLQSRARDAVAVARAIEGLLPLSPALAGTVHAGFGGADSVLSEGAKALEQVQAAIATPSAGTIRTAVEAVDAALRAVGQGTELAGRLNDALDALKEVTETAGTVKAAIDNPMPGVISDALTQASQALERTGGGGLAPVLASALGIIGTILQTPGLGALTSGVGIAVTPVGIVAGVAFGAWQAWKIGLQHYQRWMARVLDRPVTRDLFPEAAWDGIVARKLFAEVPALDRIFGANLDVAAPQVSADLLALFFLPDAVEKLRAGELPPGCFPIGKRLAGVGEEGGFLSEAEIEASVNALRRVVLDQEIDRGASVAVPLGDERSLSQAEFRVVLDRLREAGAGGAIETVGLLVNALVRRPVRDPATGQESTVEVERLLREALAAARSQPEAAPKPPQPAPPSVELE